jgi:hypothetical protein
VIPNLATDLILPPIMRVVPPLLAGKLVAALTVLLPTTGSIVLSRACFGRLSFWQLGAGFAAYNTLFLFGMLNFQLAVGVALWGAAAWVATSARDQAARPRQSAAAARGTRPDHGGDYGVVPARGALTPSANASRIS